MDPASIAGLTIAVLDQLLKIGERTYELVQDARAFDDETQKLSNKIGDENLRTRLLRGLLFSEAAVYGNKCLFEQFEPDIQKQIQLLLGPLKGILQEGCDLLERRYGVAEPSPGLVSPTSSLSLASTITPNSHIPLQRSKSPSIPDYFRWSFQDKKRVKAIVDEVGDQNNRIHEKIKLWCLASQLGVNVQHLQRLQDDAVSRQLGFDVDATLRLTQWEAVNDPLTMELTDPSWNKYLKPITPVANQGKFATFTKDETAYVHEGHDYDFDAKGQLDVLDGRTRKKVDDLAKLLHQPKEQVFRIPRCIGWKFMSMHKSIGFVFEMPSSPDAQPISLLRLLSNSDVKPELGDKFRLALNLARCISQLHMVKWVSMPLFNKSLMAYIPKRFMKVSEAKTFFSSHQPTQRWTSPNRGSWDSISVDQNPTSQQVRQTLYLWRIYIDTPRGKVNQRRCFPRSTIFMHWVLCCLRSDCGSLPSSSRRICLLMLEIIMRSKRS